FRPRRVAFKMSDERFQGFNHVPVAEVPGLNLPTEHGAVILLGVPDEARVLFGKKVIILGEAAVALREVGRAASQIQELVDDGAFAGFAQIKTRRVAVRLAVLAVIFETGIAIARALRG